MLTHTNLGTSYHARSSRVSERFTIRLVQLGTGAFADQVENLQVQRIQLVKHVVLQRVEFVKQGFAWCGLAHRCYREEGGQRGVGKTAALGWDSNRIGS